MKTVLIVCFLLSRVEREIQKLRQRISEGEENNRTHSISNDEKTSHNSPPVSHIQSLNTLLPLSDDRYTSESSAVLEFFTWFTLQGCSPLSSQELFCCWDRGLIFPSTVNWFLIHVFLLLLKLVRHCHY